MSDNKEFTPVDAATATLAVEKAAEKPAEKPVKQEKKAKGVDKQAFIARKLKAINLMTNEAKARGLAERVMRNH